VAKQMKILHLKGFSPPEKEAFREVVYSNILNCVKTLVGAARDFQYPLQNEQAADNIMAMKEVSSLTPEMWEDIKKAWRDTGAQEAWKRANEFQLIDAAPYFFKELDRIAAAGAGYIPTDDDILHARQMTTGIVEIEWDLNDWRFKMMDVGGQRNHRNKWIHCFDGVTAVIFCISLSEFDQVLREDETKNRMQESLELFDSLVNSEWFWRTPFIIFFNKMDLFEAKIKETDLKVCFENYTGGCDKDKAQEFIKDQFLAVDLKRSPTRSIYYHFTTATSTENIKKVFDVVRDVLVKKHLGSVFGN